MIIMEESQHHLILFRSHLKIFEVTYQKKKNFFWSHILSLQFIIASLFFRRVFIDCFIIIIF